MPDPSDKTHSRRPPGATGLARSLRQGDNLAEGRLRSSCRTPAWRLQVRPATSHRPAVRRFRLPPASARRRGRWQPACRQRRRSPPRRFHDRCRLFGAPLLEPRGRSQIGPVCETMLAALTGSLAENTVAAGRRFSGEATALKSPRALRPPAKRLRRRPPHRLRAPPDRPLPHFMGARRGAQALRRRILSPRRLADSESRRALRDQLLLSPFTGERWPEGPVRGRRIRHTTPGGTTAPSLEPTRQRSGTRHRQLAVLAPTKWGRGRSGEARDGEGAPHRHTNGRGRHHNRSCNQHGSTRARDTDNWLSSPHKVGERWLGRSPRR